MTYLWEGSNMILCCLITNWSEYGKSSRESMLNIKAKLQWCQCINSKQIQFAYSQFITLQHKNIPPDVITD